MPSSSRLARAVALSVALAPFSAAAHEFRAGDLVIQNPWTRATPKGAAVAGGYMTIVNHGSAADTLTGGSFAAAATFELHTMANENGVMTMRPAGPVTIPAGGAVTLAPAGLHIMLKGLRRGLAKGDKVDGTLVFDHAGTVPVQFAVEGIGAKAPDGGTQAMPGMTMD